MNNIKDIEKFGINLIQDELMSKHTTYKIGGPAKYFACVENIEDLNKVLEFTNSTNLKTFVVGGGSNLLVSDKGFDGLVIKLEGNFTKVILDDDNLYKCGSGAKTSNVLNTYLNNSHKGAEFLSGIPGTLGGAVKMNAGRGDRSISQIIESVEILNKDCEIRNMTVDEIEWGYRHSSINDNEIILSVNLKFENCNDVNLIQKEIEQLKQKRVKSQPIDKLSCGSVFKNPEDSFAGKLIEDAGLKGKRIGGASISDVHANFIINENNATAKDVVDLIQLIQKTVYEKFDEKLIPELKFLGFDCDCSLF